MKRFSAQSAMEYLMTYGWAILIIIIVLGVLYLLGVFSPNGLLGNQCNVQFKYSCTGLTIATNGTASFLLGQNTGSNFYNVEVACTESINSTGGPYAGSSPWFVLTSELDSGTSVQVNNTPCYSTTSSLLGTQTIGTTFDGYLWLRYTTAPTPEGGANGWVTQKVATVHAAVGKVGGGAASTSATTTASGSATSSTTTTTSTTTISGTFLTGGNTGSPAITAIVAGTWSNYICAAAQDSCLTSPNWVADAEDALRNATDVGRLSGAYCSVGSPNVSCVSASKLGITASIATIGLDNAPAPVVNKQALFPPEDGSATAIGDINYTITQPNSFVVIAISCQYSSACVVAWPSGCTPRQDLADSNGDVSYIATCQSQPNGKYYADITITVPAQACAIRGESPLGRCAAISAASYVYANYAPTGS